VRRTRYGVRLGLRKGGEQGSTVELEQRRQWWGGGSWVHEQGLGLAFIAARERGGSAGRDTRSLGRCAALGQGSGRGRRVRRAASVLGTPRCRTAVMVGSGAQRGRLGRRSGDGTGRAACSSWKAMSGAQRASGHLATLLHSWVNGGRRCVVVAERPSGLRRVRGGAEALMAGLGSQRGGRRRCRSDGAAAAAAA